MSKFDQLLTQLEQRRFAPHYYVRGNGRTTFTFSRLTNAVDFFELTSIYASKQNHTPVLTIRGPLSDAPGRPAEVFWNSDDDDAVLQAWEHHT